jgi:hypothetical protein
MSSPLDHLLSAREAYASKRREFDDLIKQLDSMINTERARSQSLLPLPDDAPKPSTSPAASSPARDAIRALFPILGKKLTPPQVWRKLTEQGYKFSRGYIRVALDKLAEEGAISLSPKVEGKKALTYIINP